MSFVASRAMQGHIELKWMGHSLRGLACDLKSVGYEASAPSSFSLSLQCLSVSTGFVVVVIGHLRGRSECQG